MSSDGPKCAADREALHVTSQDRLKRKSWNEKTGALCAG